MALSRRTFLRSLGAGATAGALPFSLPGFSSGSSFPVSQSLGTIRLDRNENPFGPSQKVAETLRSASSTVNRYPASECEKLSEQIAAFHRVNPAQVLLGCGSTDILRMAALAFLGPGKQLVQASPTFEAMEHYAQPTGAEVVRVPLAKDFAHDLDAMAAHGTTSVPTLFYICNPNNPTASLTPRKALENFIRDLPRHGYVLIDEAYHDYAAEGAMYQSFIKQPINDERVIVTRTFSKVYGLAGLRLGFGVAQPRTAEKLRQYAGFNNVNSVVASAATAALEDQAGVRGAIKRNADDRQEFFNQAMARMLKPIDSHANFVMMNTHHPAKEVITYFREHNILLGRAFPPLSTYIRVSLGRPHEMLAFWRTWDQSSYANTSGHH